MKKVTKATKGVQKGDILKWLSTDKSLVKSTNMSDLKQSSGDSCDKEQTLPSLIKDTIWKSFLNPEFSKDYFKKLEASVLQSFATKQVFPPKELIFNALHLTPLNNVKVVILGQDPYHDDGQAHGLCFSVPLGIKPPPSLKNIYKELSTDISGFEIPNHGNLEKWATNGVLLLNAILTVEAHKAGSHSKFGWEKFTDNLLSKLSKEKSGLVFMLWGKFAEKKGAFLDKNRHLVLISAHPSPLAGGAFFGCKHFSKANEYLTNQGKEPVDWKLT